MRQPTCMAPRFRTDERSCMPPGYFVCVVCGVPAGSEPCLISVLADALKPRFSEISAPKIPAPEVWWRFRAPWTGCKWRVAATG